MKKISLTFSLVLFIIFLSFSVLNLFPNCTGGITFICLVLVCLFINQGVKINLPVLFRYFILLSPFTLFIILQKGLFSSAYLQFVPYCFLGLLCLPKTRDVYNRLGHWADEGQWKAAPPKALKLKNKNLFFNCINISIVSAFIFIELNNLFPNPLGAALFVLFALINYIQIIKTIGKWCSEETVFDIHKISRYLIRNLLYITASLFLLFIPEIYSYFISSKIPDAVRFCPLAILSLITLIPKTRAFLNQANSWRKN